MKQSNEVHKSRKLRQSYSIRQLNDTQLVDEQLQEGEYKEVAKNLQCAKAVTGLRAIPEKRRAASDNPFVRTTVDRPDEPVMVFCASCKSEASKQLDKLPSYVTMDPFDGAYIARKSQTCITPGCCIWQAGRKTEVWLIPVDPDVWYVLQSRLTTAWQSMR